MQTALLLSKRSHSPGTKVGAVVVSSDNTRVLAVGYNGLWSGGPNVVENLEPGQSGTIHAELNALIKLDYSDLHKKVMYVTVSPCVSCASAIINANINEIVYDEQYRLTEGLHLLQSAGISVRKFSLSKACSTCNTQSTNCKQCRVCGQILCENCEHISCQ
jgi:dCMP deaminase